MSRRNPPEIFPAAAPEITVKADDPVGLFAGCGLITAGDKEHLNRTTDLGNTGRSCHFRARQTPLPGALPRITPTRTESSRLPCSARCTSLSRQRRSASSRQNATAGGVAAGRPDLHEGPSRSGSGTMNFMLPSHARSARLRPVPGRPAASRSELMRCFQWVRRDITSCGDASHRRAVRRRSPPPEVGSAVAVAISAPLASGPTAASSAMTTAMMATVSPRVRP